MSLVNFLVIRAESRAPEQYGFADKVSDLAQIYGSESESSPRGSFYAGSPIDSDASAEKNKFIIVDGDTLRTPIIL